MVIHFILHIWDIIYHLTSRRATHWPVTFDL